MLGKERNVKIMAKEFVYMKKRELGSFGNNTIEIGNFVVDGKQMSDKVYLVNHFTRKNGTEDSKATAICQIDEAEKLSEILKGV